MYVDNHYANKHTRRILVQIAERRSEFVGWSFMFYKCAFVSFMCVRVHVLKFLKIWHHWCTILFFRDGTINVQEFAALWKYIQDWKNMFDRFDPSSFQSYCYFTQYSRMWGKFVRLRVSTRAKIAQSPQIYRTFKIQQTSDTWDCSHFSGEEFTSQKAAALVHFSIYSPVNSVTNKA